MFCATLQTVCGTRKYTLYISSLSRNHPQCIKREFLNSDVTKLKILCHAEIRWSQSGWWRKNASYDFTQERDIHTKHNGNCLADCSLIHSPLLELVFSCPSTSAWSMSEGFLTFGHTTALYHLTTVLHVFFFSMWVRVGVTTGTDVSCTLTVEHRAVPTSCCWFLKYFWAWSLQGGSKGSTLQTAQQLWTNGVRIM